MGNWELGIGNWELGMGNGELGNGLLLIVYGLYQFNVKLHISRSP